MSFCDIINEIMLQNRLEFYFLTEFFIRFSRHSSVLLIRIHVSKLVKECHYLEAYDFDD
jgi:hypothetical protein